MLKISEEEIRQRMQKLRNYENILYPRLKERSDKLREKVKELKEENQELKKNSKQIEKLLLELEELREMVYGKKQKERKNDKVSLPGKDSRKGEKPPKKKRTPESYRRKEPKPEDVTGEIRYDLPVCPDCGNELTQRKEHVHYREDLEGLDILLKQAKKITKRIIESGYCCKCQKRKRGFDIPEQTVVIGQNIKATMVYLHVLLGLSYKETEEYLKLQHNFKISEGQIGRSLQEQADLLRPFYQKIFQKLQREKGAHYDETSWKVQGESEGNHAWIKTGTESNNVIFWFGKSRGKRVAEKLRGDNKLEYILNQVGISDDYGSYRNLFKYHALCWAHPHRKLRDLAESNSLKLSIKKHCQKVYKDYAKLYKKVDKAKEKFNSGGYKTKEEREQDIEQFKKSFDKITIPDKKDPDKLRCIKKSLKDRKDCYFICLKIKGIPLDNNKAERFFRKVVLKRKKSFGSKSQKGANTLSILYSVVFSIYWSHPPEEFFEHYQNALNLIEK